MLFDDAYQNQHHTSYNDKKAQSLNKPQPPDDYFISDEIHCLDDQVKCYIFIDVKTLKLKKLQAIHIDSDESIDKFCNFPDEVEPDFDMIMEIFYDVDSSLKNFIENNDGVELQRDEEFTEYLNMYLFFFVFESDWF